MYKHELHNKIMFADNECQNTHNAHLNTMYYMEYGLL